MIATCCWVIGQTIVLYSLVGEDAAAKPQQAKPSAHGTFRVGTSPNIAAAPSHREGQLGPPGFPNVENGGVQVVGHVCGTSKGSHYGFAGLVHWRQGGVISYIFETNDVMIRLVRYYPRDDDWRSLTHVRRCLQLRAWQILPYIPIGEYVVGASNIRDVLTVWHPCIDGCIMLAAKGA